MHSKCFYKISASNLRLLSLFRLQIKHPRIVRKIPKPGLLDGCTKSRRFEPFDWEDQVGRIFPKTMCFTWKKLGIDPWSLPSLPTSQKIHPKTMMDCKKKTPMESGITKFSSKIPKANSGLPALGCNAGKVCRCPSKFGWWSEADELDWTITGLQGGEGGIPFTMWNPPGNWEKIYR